VRKTHISFVRLFILKTIILPRQARDKHRKKLRNERRFWRSECHGAAQDQRDVGQHADRLCVCCYYTYAASSISI
jgi:hypothetical protein